ncbi:MAG: glycine cleavage system aminomethyltransferase GcvT [Halobacteriales archaeon]
MEKNYVAAPRRGNMARRPPLYEVHEASDARTTEFGGWEMPVRFTSTKEEHTAVREEVGKFDVSHMGRVRVTGDDGVGLAQRMTTNDVEELNAGEAQYSAIVDEDGTLVDDTVVYRDEDGVMFVPNAGRDKQAVERWRERAEDEGYDARVENRTDGTAMFAVQGPDAAEAARGAGTAVDNLPRFGWRTTRLGDVPAFVSRTGYTGEDGFEFVVDADDAADAWNTFDATPCGLGARDTLRIEMGFLLAGHEFGDDSPRTPYEAGIGFVVAPDTGFVGSDALRDELNESLVGFRLEERAVPRKGYAVRVDGEEVGEVTSGTVSPTLDEPIGMAYLPVEYAEEGTKVEVVVRDEPKQGSVEEPPFV